MDESCSDFENAEQEEFTSDQSATTTKRKNSFVWKYFRPVEGTEGCVYECVICNGCVGNQTSNLSRHLASAHDITNRPEGLVNNGRGRPSRSFIWKYCTKEDAKHARCHLCNKILYFGGGNTANISKHLRRKHQNLIQSKEDNMDIKMETAQAIAAINGLSDSSFKTPKKDAYNLKLGSERRERKGGSYVWNFCDKLSRHTIRCKLCNKVMSFHGTANVITHLQRKHNIVGRVEKHDDSGDNTNADFEESFEIEQLDDTEDKRRRRYSASASIVWKYCTRISKDLVRCGFCKKNLSYQGTSNLQRHLHRMHGVVTPGRVTKGVVIGDPVEVQYKLVSSDFIWEHCTMLDDDKTKCNMCDAVFNREATEEINKHLTVTHSIQPRRPVKRRKIKRDDSADDTSESSDEFHQDTWSKHDETDQTQEFDDGNIKKDEFLYDDIIVEEHEQTNIDEEPFDPSAPQEIPLANPLSPQSSRGGGSPIPEQRLVYNSKQLQKLNEERVRMETEYFREKAGFYRMQKYLTALQAKKVRVELERYNNVELNVAYTVDVGSLPQQ